MERHLSPVDWILIAASHWVLKIPTHFSCHGHCSLISPSLLVLTLSILLVLRFLEFPPFAHLFQMTLPPADYIFSFQRSPAAPARIYSLPLVILQWVGRGNYRAAFRISFCAFLVLQSQFFFESSRKWPFEISSIFH